MLLRKQLQLMVWCYSLRSFCETRNIEIEDFRSISDIEWDLQLSVQIDEYSNITPFFSIQFELHLIAPIPHQTPCQRLIASDFL